jgi:primosomal protein N' (replication factor Y)
VATDKPLTLRRQKGKPTTRVRQSSNSLQVEVLIETGVFHLEQTFSYFLPEELEDLVHVGSLVRVPFKSDLLTGVVLSIKDKSQGSLKPVHSLLTQVRLTDRFLDFTKKVGERYIANQATIIASALPTFKTEVDSSLSAPLINPWKPSRQKRRLFLLNRSESIEARVVRLVRERVAPSLLLILPTKKEIDKVLRALGEVKQEVIEIGSHLTPSQRRKNFESAATSSPAIVIGTRSAILTPMIEIDEIVVIDEAVEHFQEQKAPYWNLRDMALLRSESEQCSISFISHSISLELARLVEMGWITQFSERKFLSGQRLSVATEPDSYHQTIRKGLRNGPVLVSVSDKGYANTFSCQRCRNIAACKCGGRLIISKKNKYSCSICDFKSDHWRCQLCQLDQIRIVKGGAEKIVEELGKAFPRVAIFTSTGDKEIETLDDSPVIVVSTFGVEPEVLGGYAAAVLLNGETLLNRAFIRSEEELRFRWFKLAAKVRSSGFIYLSLPASHSLCQALIADNAMRAIRTEIAERDAVSLPPSVRIIQVSGEERSISGLRRKLMEQFKELEILTSSDNRTIHLKIHHHGANSLLASLKALQKYRSASGQELFLIRVDPYRL